MQRTLPVDRPNAHRRPGRLIRTRVRAILADLALEVHQADLRQEERAFLATNHGGAYTRWYGEA